MTESGHNSDRKRAVPVKVEDRRKCKRLPLSFPIKVSGTDTAGEEFSDLTVTTDVSDQGCRFDLLRNLQLGDVLTIQIVERDTGKPGSAPPIHFEVAWVGASDWGWSIGVVSAQPGNLWHVAFPKKNPVRNS